MTIEEVDIQELFVNFGTPTFVISKKKLLSNYKKLTKAFSKCPCEVRTFYSFKTNSNSSICSLLKENGSGAEVVSGLELFIALKVGFPGDKIIFNGPAKNYQEIYHAIENKVYLINIESLEELETIIRICNKTKNTTNIGVRIDPFEDVTSKFGLLPKDAIKIYAQAIHEKRLFIRGIHMHIGTNITNIRVYEKTLKQLLALKECLEKKLNLNIEVVDIGGGFPNDQLLNPGRVMPIDSFADIVSGSISKSASYSDFKLAVEPGRYIVNDAVICISKVISIKQKNKQRWIICDVGLNNLPSLLSAKYEIFVPPIPGRGMTSNISLGGPLCMKHDVLPTSKFLRPLKTGDYILILNCGAYTMSLANQFSYPRPAIVLVDGNKYRLVRKRETYQDVLSKEIS